MGAAGGIVGDGFFAEGAFSWFFSSWLWEETIDLFDGHENDEGDDEEVDDCIQEFPIGNHWDAQFFCFCHGGNWCTS